METSPRPDLFKHARENVISGRPLSDYEKALGFKRSELAGKRVLNFGCGGSNIGKEFAESGIDCAVTAVDLLPNPHTVHDEGLAREQISLRRSILERKIQDSQSSQPVFPDIEEHENQLLGIDNRNFIQLTNQETLPFSNDSFDEVFMYWIYHQLPLGEREQYLKELLRVAKSIRIAPVGRNELDEIEDIVSELPAVQLTTTHLTESDPHYIGRLDIDRTKRPHEVSAINTVCVLLERK